MATVVQELTGRREFSQFVADHVFRNVNAGESLAVVHEESVPNEIRNDQAVTRPGLDWLLVFVASLLVDLSEKLVVNEGTFFE